MGDAQLLPFLTQIARFRLFAESQWLASQPSCSWPWPCWLFSQPVSFRRSSCEQQPRSFLQNYDPGCDCGTSSVTGFATATTLSSGAAPASLFLFANEFILLFVLRVIAMLWPVWLLLTSCSDRVTALLSVCRLRTTNTFRGQRPEARGRRN